MVPCWIFSQWEVRCLFALIFFDDEIDSIRTFDVDTQRTLDEINSINLLPAHEFPTDDKGIEFFRAQFREIFGRFAEIPNIFISKSVKVP